ncbi:MAG: SBBP repeat-containing protein [Roseimicrobium sp.]
MAKYDASGTLIWKRLGGSVGNERAIGVATDGAGNAYITGYTSGNLGREDSFLAAYGPSGTELWVRQLSTDSYDISYGVAVDSSRNVYVTGWTGGNLGGPNASPYLTADIFLAKYSPPCTTSIHTHPAGQTLCQGGTASFTVAGEGTGPFSYQWRKGGTPIDTIANSTAAAATLTLANVTPADAGDYDCIVIVAGGCTSATSNPAALTVKSPPSFSQQPDIAIACPSGPAAFSVTATGVGGGTLTYQWQYQGGPNNPDPLAWTNLVNGRNPAVGPFRLNATNARTRLLVVEQGASPWPDPSADHIPYVFRCIVTNTCGSTPSNAAALTLAQSCALADIADDSSQTARCGNGAVGPEDLEAFVNGFIADNAAIADLASDSSDPAYNPNGSVGPEDLEAFVNSFIAGC